MTISNSLDEIRRVNQALDAFGERHRLDAEVRRKLSVVLDELLNNTISYGYDDEERHHIDLSISLSGGRLHVTISDDGTPYNPFEREQPDTELSVDERPIGGLGVHLVSSMMDHVSYERRGDRNVLVLELRIDSAKQAGDEGFSSKERT